MAKKGIDWEEVAAFDRRLKEGDPLPYDSTADVFIQRWEWSEHSTSDGLTSLHMLVGAVIERGYPSAASAIAVRGLEVALQNARRIREYSESMVWVSVNAIAADFERFPFERGLYWAQGAVKWTADARMQAQLHRSAGHAFEVADYPRPAVEEWRLAYERHVAAGARFEALEAYAEANRLVLKHGYDMYAVDFAYDIFDNKGILAQARESIFLAGSDDVRDIDFYLNEQLPRYGYRGIWFHRHFKTTAKDTMEECLENVRRADRLLLVLDKRYGLPARRGGTSITEAEFKVAYAAKKPVLVFVRSDTWNECRRFHRALAAKPKVTEADFAKLGLKAERGVYEFVDRLQHMEEKEDKRVPWIEQFDFADQIIKSLVEKWGLGFCAASRE